MKKKEIEKIPFRTAETADKKFAYIAKSFMEEIKGTEHLFVEIYNNQKKSLLIPRLRMIFTKEDWGVYYPNENVWSNQGVQDEYGRNIWENSLNKRSLSTFISDREEDAIWDYCEGIKIGYSNRKYDSWTDRLADLTNTVKHERRAKRDENRRKRLKDRMENTPDLPEDLEEWADNHLFQSSHFLYYKRNGRYADIACSACGHASTVAVKRKDSFEGEFERVITPPRSGYPGKCPHCGAHGVWRAKGRMKGVYEVDKYCFVGQPYKGKGVVIRYVEIGKMYSLQEAGAQGEEMTSASEKMIITEIARRYIEKGKKTQTDYHKFSSYTGEFWDDCNLYGMQNIVIKPAAVYNKTYQMLQDTDFKYSGAENFEKDRKEYHLMDYMERYAQWPQIEMFSKMGLYGVVEEMIAGRCGIITNQHAKRPEDFLGIYKHRMKRLINEKGNISYLNAMKKERRMNARWSDKELEMVRITGIEGTKLKNALKYMTMKQLVNRLEKYSGCEIPTHSEEYLCAKAEGNIKGAASTYLDYLEMREMRGYDLQNTVFLFPHDLKQEHDLMVMEINAEEIDKRKEEVKRKYPDIRANYRKLRNRYFYEDDAYLIRPARSAEEIVQEGRILHHCVGGDNYLRKHNTGASYILFLRKQEAPEIPFVTVEINHTRIIQWYGAYDKKPDEKKIKRWLNDYIKVLEEGKSLQYSMESIEIPQAAG